MNNSPKNSLRSSLVDRLETKDIYLQKRRVRQASASILADDYVIQQELTAAAAGLQTSINKIVSQTGSGLVREFLQVAIPNPANYPFGTMIWVSDFNHFLLNVSGSWLRLLPNLYLQFFLATPDPIEGWQICDGSTGISYLKADGTLGTISVPNVPFYPRADSTYDGPSITTAVLPNVVNPTDTGTGFAVIGNNSAIQALTAGPPIINVARDPHTHADSGHTHTIADPTVSLPGDPLANIGFIAYVRL